MRSDASGMYGAMRRLARVTLFVGMFVSALAATAAPEALTACADETEFPPFTYYERTAGRRTAALTGYSVELLRSLLGTAGVKLSVRMQPWMRCLVTGSRGEFDILLDGARSPQKEKDFLFAHAHARLAAAGLIFRRANAPALPAGMARLLTQELCGIHGYDYEAGGLPRDAVRQRAVNYSGALKMLRAGRCDFLIAGELHLLAQVAMGADALKLGDDLVYASVPWAPPLALHFMVPRTHPRAQEIIELIDRGLVRLRNNGELAKLDRRFLQLQP